MRNTLVLWEVIVLATTAAVASVVVANDKLPGQGLAGDELLRHWSPGQGVDAAGSLINKTDDLTVPDEENESNVWNSVVDFQVQEEENDFKDWNSVVDFQVQEEENDFKDWNSDVDFQVQEEENDSEDWNSIEERGKYCVRTFLCKEAGGYCVKTKNQCSGKVDKQGCKGGKKCLCCVPEKTTPTPVTCPTTTCAPCPGPTVNPNLNWLTTGSDRFVRFPQEMNWNAARALCKKNGLDLYHPKNITAVAIYLEAKFRDSWYWFGAKGNGTHQVWFSGEVLTRAEPWYANYYTKVSTYDCLAAITHSGWALKKQFLFGGTCTRTNIDVICG